MTIIPSLAAEQISRSILILRGQRVMLDSDLARLYGVLVKRLNEAVKRNSSRFPSDFMFQLTADELADLKRQTESAALRSQFATLEVGKGKYRKYPPYAFTEQGVAMLSSVLRSERAVQVNIAIMRVFAKVREFLSANKELAKKLLELEGRVSSHDKHIQSLFEAIRQLMAPSKAATPRIGFKL